MLHTRVAQSGRYVAEGREGQLAITIRRHPRGEVSLPSGLAFADVSRVRQCEGEPLAA